MDKNSPLISVVIPTFNREKTIKYCIDSVLAQTYQNFEIVIGDDFSTDSTIKIIKDYEDNRIKIIQSEKKIGAQGARNLAIKNSSGNFIAFLDSDDEFLPDKLEKQVEILRQNDFDQYLLIHSDAILYNVSTGEKKPYNLSRVEGEDVYNIYLQRSAILFCSVLTSKKAIEEIGYLDENVPSYQEWDTAIRLSKICKFVQIEEPSFIYYVHHGEAISKNSKKDIDGYEYIIKKYENEIKRVCGKQAWVVHLQTQCDRCLNWEFYDEALYYLSKMPFSIKRLKLQIKVLKKKFRNKNDKNNNKK